jgi:hypothetical protein
MQSQNPLLKFTPLLEKNPLFEQRELKKGEVLFDE